jgi:hypothetical protein
MQCNYLKYNYLIFRTPLKVIRKDRTNILEKQIILKIAITINVS